MRTWIVALRAALLSLLVTGLVYPLVVTILTRLVCPDTASGSWVRDDSGREVGSALIAQAFHDPGYLHARPSAVAYDASASGGSNAGPTSAALRSRVEAAAASLRAANPRAAGPPPVELVTTSASGLDPDLALPAALWQVPRIAAARHVEPARIASVIHDSAEGRVLGLWGEPRVGVLECNLRLDRLLGRPALASPSPAQ